MQRALATIDRGWRDALAALTLVETDEDRQAAFELADHLAEKLATINTEASEIRRSRIRRIWDAEKLSLARLADKVGISKTRAEQLVKTFRADQTEPREGP